MPLIDVHVIKDVFNQAQKKEIIEKRNYRKNHKHHGRN
jgi:hypothetical protein